ncbi:MAG: monofunctional biosynthetic peptidoglycan transglycosylase [Myxococcota bacterium]
MTRARPGERRRRTWRRPLVVLVGLAALAPAAYVASAVVFFPAVLRHGTEAPESWAMLELRAREAERAQTEWAPRFRWVPLSEFSPHVVQAVLTAEDSPFYEHGGFDYDELTRARETGDTRGTSTITQQTVKNLYLSPSRSVPRKLREALLTWWMELWLPKDRILELYLNIVELGPGIFGFEAASRFYFDRSANAVSPEQAALLAATLPAPLLRHPASPSPDLERRQRAILSRMRQYYQPSDSLLAE